MVQEWVIKKELYPYHRCLYLPRLDIIIMKWNEMITPEIIKKIGFVDSTGVVYGC